MWRINWENSHKDLETASRAGGDSWRFQMWGRWMLWRLQCRSVSAVSLQCPSVRALSAFTEWHFPSAAGFPSSPYSHGSKNKHTFTMALWLYAKAVHYGSQHFLPSADKISRKFRTKSKMHDVLCSRWNLRDASTAQGKLLSWSVLLDSVLDSPGIKRPRIKRKVQKTFVWKLQTHVFNAYSGFFNVFGFLSILETEQGKHGQNERLSWCLTPMPSIDFRRRSMLTSGLPWMRLGWNHRRAELIQMVSKNRTLLDCDKIINHFDVCIY